MKRWESLIQPPLWLKVEEVQALIEEASGERARHHFRHLNLMGGYAPSPQIEEVVEYIESQARTYGLEDLVTEKFPSDGERFYWALLTEPSWDARKGSLWQVSPKRRLLSDFAITPGALGRFSRSITADAELIYVGAGTAPEDYEVIDVAGKIVLATGEMGSVHSAAVYERGALGVIIF